MNEKETDICISCVIKNNMTGWNTLTVRVKKKKKKKCDDSFA